MRRQLKPHEFIRAGDSLEGVLLSKAGTVRAREVAKAVYRDAPDELHVHALRLQIGPGDPPQWVEINLDGSGCYHIVALKNARAIGQWLLDVAGAPE